MKARLVGTVVGRTTFSPPVTSLVAEGSTLAAVVAVIGVVSMEGSVATQNLRARRSTGAHKLHDPVTLLVTLTTTEMSLTTLLPNQL
jgi:hypothetical protein